MDDGSTPRASPRTQATLRLYCYCDLPHTPYVIHSTCHPGRHGGVGGARISANPRLLACWCVFDIIILQELLPFELCRRS